MAPDRGRVEEARAWLEKAGSDLRAAEVLSAPIHPVLEAAAFHCQQAVEKALKAFLVWHDVSFRRTHSLEEIGEQSLSLDPSLSGMIGEAVPLSEFAWRYRYPGDVIFLEPEEVDDALAVAGRIVAAIANRLGLETGC